MERQASAVTTVGMIQGRSTRPVRMAPALEIMQQECREHADDDLEDDRVGGIEERDLHRLAEEFVLQQIGVVPPADVDERPGDGPVGEAQADGLEERVDDQPGQEHDHREDERDRDAPVRAE